MDNGDGGTVITDSGVWSMYGIYQSNRLLHSINFMVSMCIFLLTENSNFSQPKSSVWIVKGARGLIAF